MTTDAGWLFIVRYTPTLLADQAALRARLAAEADADTVVIPRRALAAVWTVPPPPGGP